MSWFWACWLGLVAGMMVLAAQSAGERRFRALVVGVSEYENSNLAKLAFASKDASDLEAVLKELGYDVKCLNTERGRRDALLVPNKRNIEEAVEWLARNRKRNETILLALSGHGVNMVVKEANKRFPFFCPSDASPDDRSVKLESGDHESMVNINNVMKRLAASGAEDKVILIDACRGRVEARARKVDFDDVTVPKGLAVMYGCKQDQFSYESSKFRNGYFTHWVLEGLKGKAAREEDGEIDFASLQSFVTRKMRNSQTEIGEDQQPRTVMSETGVVTLAMNARKDRPARDDAERTAERTITNSIGMKLARIPKGKFMMGSPETEAERATDETRHEVILTKDFYLGVYEVTQAEYEKVMGNNPSESNGARLPVDRVFWNEAFEFCKKLSELPEEKKAGRIYRLPTEAEWEYACRAGTTTPFHFGTALNGTQANCNGSVPYGTTIKGLNLQKTIAVGNYAANAWGLHDMHGNVWEWCSDRYGEYPVIKTTDPQGPQKGEYRVLRGGSWFRNPKHCRASFRTWIDSVSRHHYFGIGFRVLLSLNS